MLPEDEEELFVDWQGSTWNRIVVFHTVTGDELLRLRTPPNDEFKEFIIEAYGGKVRFQYVGGSMDGAAFH